MPDSLADPLIILLLVSLFISAVGFYRVVYFVSVGYALAITGMVIAAVILFRSDLAWLPLIQCLLLAIYGLRLGQFVFLREFKPSYRRELAEIREEEQGFSSLAKIGIWLIVSLLYVLMFSPALFNLLSTSDGRTLPTPLALIIGTALMLVGLVLESVADRQKSIFKQAAPEAFCDVGLYRWVRCPNYFGELVFWAGNWVAGVAAYTQGLFWLMSLLGLAGITFVMLVSTARLEQRQDERYGGQPNYQAYARSVPILFPYIPLYSVKKFIRLDFG